MKTLALIAILSLTVHAQSLVSADGAVWHYIASGRDKDGAKFNVFARRVKGDEYPALEVKFGAADVVQAEHDCRLQSYRFNGGEWAKPSPRSVGAALVKFACRK